MSKSICFYFQVHQPYISLTGFARIVSSKSVRNTITMTTTATA